MLDKNHIFLEKMSKFIDIKYIEDLIDAYDPPKRYRKVKTSVVLNCVLNVLNGWTWRDIRKMNICPSTIYRRFKLWTKNNILKNVWIHLLKEYSEKKLRGNPLHFKELFIDSSMIKNISGHECLGKNPTDRGRQATKLSVICDTNQVPISACFYPANKSDISTAMETVESIQCEI